MKKTKLFTSIAALALVLGLGACETTSEEEDTPEESETTTETTDTSESTPTTPSEDPDGYVLVGDFTDSNWDAKVSEDSKYYIPLGTTEYKQTVTIAAEPDYGEYDPWDAGLRVVEWGDSWNLVVGSDELDEASTGVTGSDSSKNIKVNWGETYDITVTFGDTNSILVTLQEEGGNEGDGEETAYKFGAADLKAATYRYFTGISSSAGQTSTTWEEGTDVYLETEIIDGVAGYAFRYISGEYTDYIAYNGSSTGLKYATEPYYWGYDSEHDAYVDNVSGTSGRFLGIQDGYEVIRAYATSNYPSTTNPYGYYIATLYSEEPATLEPLPEVEVPNLEMVTSITSGNEYYLGYESEEHGLSMFNGTSWNNQALYVSYEESADSWVKVTATGDDSSGYTLTFTDSSSVNQTIYGYKSGNYLDLGYAKTDDIDSTIANVTDGASATFAFDTTNNGLTTTFGSTTYYIGVNASYANEIAIFTSGSTNTWCHLYTEVEA